MRLSLIRRGFAGLCRRAVRCVVKCLELSRVLTVLAGNLYFFLRFELRYKTPLQRAFKAIELPDNAMVAFTVCDRHFADMALNWYHTMRMAGGMEHILIGTLDTDAEQFLRAHGIETVAVCSEMELSRIWWYRTYAVRELLRRGVDVLCLDCGVLPLRPLPELLDRAQDADLVGMHGIWPYELKARRGVVLCCAFLLWRSGAATLQLINAVLGRMRRCEDLDDQRVLNGVLDADSRGRWPKLESIFLPGDAAFVEPATGEAAGVRFAALPWAWCPRPKEALTEDWRRQAVTFGSSPDWSGLKKMARYYGRPLQGTGSQGIKGRMRGLVRESWLRSVGLWSLPIKEGEAEWRDNQWRLLNIGDQDASRAIDKLVHLLLRYPADRVLVAHVASDAFFTEHSVVQWDPAEVLRLLTLCDLLQKRIKLPDARRRVQQLRFCSGDEHFLDEMDFIPWEIES